MDAKKTFIKNVWILTHAVHNMANPLRNYWRERDNKEDIQLANLTFRTRDKKAFSYYSLFKTLNHLKILANHSTASYHSSVSL